MVLIIKIFELKMQIKDPVEELQSTQLFELLLNSSQEYADRITKFVEVIAEILRTTQDYFPYYTRHDAHHGFRVVRRLEQICLPNCLQLGTSEVFSPVEIFLLIAAAYAHDLGMTVFPNEEDELLESLGLTKHENWKIDPILQEYLRREHSKRGGDYINKNHEKFGVPKNLTHILDSMMKAHNFSVSELESNIPSEVAALEAIIDTRQLAVLICVADALEFSDTRVMDGVLDRIKIDDSDSARISYQENMKHVCLGDSLAIDEYGRVVVNGSFDEVEVLALAHKTFDQMEEWIQGYCDINRRSKLPRLKLNPEPFVRKFNFNLGQFERLGIRLNKRKVIDLIASNAVWNANIGIAVRELVQNAIEACRFRKFHSGPADQYSPLVEVKFDRSKRTISIIDNGCGMSERTILNNFLTVGSSRSKESSYIANTYAPIARFGIGFWSVFTIAKNVHIRTVAFEEYRGNPQAANYGKGVAFDVSLAELKDYTVFIPINQACGTQITLELREDIEFDDVYIQAKTMLLCSEIPVTFVFDNEKIEIPRNIPEITNIDVLGSRNQALLAKGVQVFTWTGQLKDTELSLGLAYLMKDGKATFCMAPSTPILMGVGGILSSKTSICGLSVFTQHKLFCFDLNRVGLFFANRLTPKDIEFSLDRQQTISNAASKQYEYEIESLVHQGYRAFLQATNSYSPEDIARLRDEAAMNGGNVYDTFTESELSNATNNYPDLISFKLFPVNQSVNNPIYLDLRTFSQQNGRVFFVQNEIKDTNGRKLYGSIGATGFTESVHKLVHQYLVSNGEAIEHTYVMEANRLASMLFDADPRSTVLLFNVKDLIGQDLILYLQCVTLGNIDYETRIEENILCSIRGRWSGTIYLRSFQADKPFLLLGRHRILIERSSTLAAHLQNLYNDGKLVKLAETIFQLSEVEEGYCSEEIKQFL